MKVLPNLTNKKKHRVEELQRKLAENENTRMQQMSTEISSTNILKHLDIKVRENTRMQQMSTEISSTNILNHLDIKVRENTSSYLETPLSLFH
jgi:oligoendopeptidase F